MEELAFLGWTPQRVLCLRGPFRRHKTPPARRPLLFAPDFFLADPAPWWEPEGWGWADPAEAAALLPEAAPRHLAWKAPGKDVYEGLFAAALRAIRGGDVEKVVPVAAWEAPAPFLPWEAARRALGAETGHAYGLLTPSEGLVGVTPEVLFRLEPDGTLHTAALAGTALPAEEAFLKADPKTRKEHELVVAFLAEALRAFGPVQVKPTTVRRLPGLIHLETPLQVRSVSPLQFLDVVRALHPTPALGGSPREAAQRWLRRYDGRRRRFGAPFGVVLPDRALCVVAIRNVQWERGHLRLWTGAGVVATSSLEAEWAELHWKARAVARQLGLPPPP